MTPNRPIKVIVVALVIAGLLPSTFLPAHAFSGGVTTVYSTPTPDRIERARTFAAKTPELDQTYQRTMRAAASKVAVAAAVRRSLRSFVEKIPLIGALAILAIDLHGIWVKVGDKTNQLMIPPAVCTIEPCKQFQFHGHLPPYADWSTSPEGATKATIAAYPSENGRFSYRFDKCTRDTYAFFCQYIQRERHLINEGYSNQTEMYTEFTFADWAIERTVDSVSQQPNASARALSDAELEDALKADKPFIPILKQMDDLGSPVPFPEPEVEDMPQPIAISPTTVTNPDGSKTITQTTLEPYRDPLDESIKWRKKEVVTEISKPDANGDTTTTTKTTTTDKGESTPAEKPPETPARDTDLPPQPKLYKRKYPQGITGVFQEQRDLMANSPLFTLAKSLMPTVGMNGACPSMPVNLNFSHWANFGTKDLAPPCHVWDWGRAICIVSACLLARRLIFGG